MKRLFLMLIKMYQWCISPLFPARCIYHPSCSHFAAEALNRFGPWRGGLLGLRRFLRCHPFRRGGYDPVPEK